MPDKRLYVLTLPAGVQTRDGSVLRQSQASDAILGGDSGDVESLGAEPGERPLVVELPDNYADVRARELNELARGFNQPVPFHGKGTTTADDAYFSVARAEPGPIDPRTQAFQRVSLRLTREGTIANKWREVKTAPTQVDHPFGSTTETEVGVPATARKVRWLDAATQKTEEVTVQSTRTAEFGTVDILDARASSYTNPNLIFEIDYADEGPVDVRVWDDRGNASRTDGNGALQWQKVFTADHRYEGQRVVSSGVFRLFVDESNNALSADEWSTASASWSALSLGASDWEIYDFDVRNISPAQAAGVAEFRDPTQSPTAFHVLTFQVGRGADQVLWSTETPVPAGLQTLLSPIAADHIYDGYGGLQSSPQGIIARSEVQ
jgi:hypothetical protein